MLVEEIQSFGTPYAAAGAQFMLNAQPGRCELVPSLNRFSRLGEACFLSARPREAVRIATQRPQGRNLRGAADHNCTLDGLLDRPLLANSRFVWNLPIRNGRYASTPIEIDDLRSGKINVVGLYWHFNHIRVRSFEWRARRDSNS
jgi:hypothetical protein